MKIIGAVCLQYKKQLNAQFQICDKTSVKNIDILRGDKPWSAFQ